MTDNNGCPLQKSRTLKNHNYLLNYDLFVPVIKNFVQGRKFNIFHLKHPPPPPTPGWTLLPRKTSPLLALTTKPLVQYFLFLPAGYQINETGNGFVAAPKRKQYFFHSCHQLYRREAGGVLWFVAAGF